VILFPDMKNAECSWKDQAANLCALRA